MKQNVFCTIFTPTFNRKELLFRLYKSLCAQTCHEFEWVIVDDGSTDGTDTMVKNLPKTDFKIIYHMQVNGGKHRAINAGLDLAQGKVFAIVDSDDYLTENAVSVIKQRFESIANESKPFAGVAALKCFDINHAVGSTFIGEWIDAKSTERSKYNIQGDKFEVFYTEILQNNKFPEIENEKFMTEAIVWNRIAEQGYYIRWYNDPIYICDYLEDGLTDSRDRLVRQSPIGYSMFIRECVSFGNITLKQKLGYYSYYYKIRKQDQSLRCISKELQANPLVIWCAYLLRSIIEILR